MRLELSHLLVRPWSPMTNVLLCHELTLPRNLAEGGQDCDPPNMLEVPPPSWFQGRATRIFSRHDTTCRLRHHDFTNSRCQLICGWRPSNNKRCTTPRSDGGRRCRSVLSG